MNRGYDVIVLGGGPAGEHCAGALAEGGLRVALVERELVGGECSYWACIPSKTLLRPGEAVHAARDAAGQAEVDVEAVFAWRDFMVSNYSDAGQERWLADAGVDFLRGDGRLAGTGTVEVDGVRFTAQHVVIATGSEPFTPAIPGLADLEGVWGSREATSMKAVPNRLLILGGGAVGVEIAQAVRRLGGEVVIVDVANRLLGREPAPLGDALGEFLRRDGVQLLLGADVSRAGRFGQGYVLELGDRSEIRGDRLLVATGRRPRVGGLGLETVGIEADCQVIPVDARLRVADGLWAIGDVNGIWPLTHVAKYQADIVAAISSVNRERLTTRPCHAWSTPIRKPPPWAQPRTGSRQRLWFRRYPRQPHIPAHIPSPAPFLTLLSDGDRLTGAFALGPEAGEGLQQATLAIRTHLPLDLLRDTIQPFPTFSEIYVATLKSLQHENSAARRVVEQTRIPTVSK